VCSFGVIRYFQQRRFHYVSKKKVFVLVVRVNFRGQRGAGETDFISPALNRPRYSYKMIGLGAAAGLLVLVWVSRRFRR
ncbi:MAG: hypothetical protein SV487_06595, partial [Thermodesulfobacteriota bacterium]|nr:hypothetical protein [Thermodesulfobacteriota bacterium]